MTAMEIGIVKAKAQFIRSPRSSQVLEAMAKYISGSWPDSANPAGRTPYIFRLKPGCCPDLCSSMPRI
jgi:hypothetical protein